ncbi:MAG: rRNA pseudouridine synthase [Treponema sp.]|nr:rRNA pseudouridine synthase [Treponema sp.]
MQVFLAHAGVASRRAAEEIIAAGRVGVNGMTVSARGSKVFPGDTVTVDGKPVQTESRRVYLALNKPPGYICSSSDPQGRPLALGLLPAEISERLYNVGRLDFLSCGLLFFTNDGGFAARLGHPRSGLEKEYLVEATGHIPDETVLAFEEGITIEGVHYRARSVERLGSRIIRIVLIEGKNREIRKVFSHFHLHPSRLRRVRIGPVKLGNLNEGESRPLTKFELEALRGNRDWGLGNRERGAGNSKYKSTTRKKNYSSDSNHHSLVPIPRSPRRSTTW